MIIEQPELSRRAIGEIDTVEVAFSRSDEYTIDIGFVFFAATKRIYSVQGIPALHDTFELSAHVLRKILKKAVSFPRTISFGFAERERRHVNFDFSIGPGESLTMRCAAYEPSHRGSNDGIVFEVDGDLSLSRLLDGFTYLMSVEEGYFAWVIGASERGV